MFFYFNFEKCQTQHKILGKMSQNQNKNEISIELNEDIADGIYSNLSIISHSNSEFIIDFIRLVPNVAKAKVKSRIISSPQHAKKLLMALNENIKRYEATHGVIKESDGIQFPMNITGPKGQA